MPTASQHAEAEEEADSVPLLSTGTSHDDGRDGSTTSFLFNADDERDSLDADGAPKYPPNAPPPSYTQVYGGRPSTRRARGIRAWWNDLTEEISLPRLSLPTSKVKAAAWQAYVAFWRVWPDSRLGQAGLTLVGMWIILLFGGPAFEERGAGEAGGGGWWGGMGVGDVQIYEPLDTFPSAPPPISGDGTVLAPMEWSAPHCSLFALQSTVPACETTANITLTIPTRLDGSASIFVYADPLRDGGLSEKRGNVMGAVRVRVDETQDKGKATFRVRARYERGRAELLRDTTVARVGGSTHEGLGIYSNPLPSLYRNRVVPALAFDVEVTLPSAADIGSLHIDSSSLDIYVFSAPGPSDIHYKLFPNHNVGASGEPIAQNGDEVIKVEDKSTFGLLEISAGAGNVILGRAGVKAVGAVMLKSTSGNFNVHGAIDSPIFEVRTEKGTTTLEQKCRVRSWQRVALMTHEGDVKLDGGAEVRSDEMSVQTRKGSIGGRGTWAANGTLSLKTDTGNIEGFVSLLPHLPDSAAALASTPVGITAHSNSGSIKLSYISQPPGVVLSSVARSQLAAVKVRLHAAYVGRWSVKGAKGKTHVKGPSGSGDVRIFNSDGVKAGAMDQSETGSITRNDVPRTKEESSVEVSSQMSSAALRFD